MALKLSRAKWDGEWYHRKGRNDWRNANTGLVSNRPGGSGKGIEKTRANVYGKDPISISSKLKKVKTENLKPTR